MFDFLKREDKAINLLQFGGGPKGTPESTDIHPPGAVSPIDSHFTL